MASRNVQKTGGWLFSAILSMTLVFGLLPSIAAAETNTADANATDAEGAGASGDKGTAADGGGHGHGGSPFVMAGARRCVAGASAVSAGDRRGGDVPLAP